MKRGERFYHHRYISPADNLPQLVEVSRTKRYTRSDGTNSTLVYYRPVHRWRAGEREGEEYYGNSIYCDIDEANRWQHAP